MTAKELISLIKIGQEQVKMTGETWVISRAKTGGETKLKKHDSTAWPNDEFAITLTKNGKHVDATITSFESSDR